MGDLVLTPSGVDMGPWWWEGKIGLVMKEAIPRYGETPGVSIPCWHILIGVNTVNIKEDSLEIIQ